MRARFLPPEIADRLDASELVRRERLLAEISGAVLPRDLPDYNPRADSEQE